MKSKSLTNNSLPQLERILVVGNGGRENSLCWGFKKSNEVKEIWIAPGNGGSECIENVKRLKIKETDSSQLIKACKELSIDLVVIGPEGPLAAGIADQLRKAKICVFGPSAKGAQLEASKAWAKWLMEEASIPTAKHWDASNEIDAINIINKVMKPLVVKADGLAAGKGVAVPESIEETKEAIKKIFEGKFGEAGSKIVLEEKLKGPEVSVFAITDGDSLVILPSAQDHKRLKDNDKGPNTGGMGAYAPAPLLTKADIAKIQTLILEPTLTALKNRGINYRGVIYAGLMLTEAGPKVIEFNCRFGDPECQTLMPLMGPELAHVIHASALGCLNKAPKLTILQSCSACVVAASEGYPEAPKTGEVITSRLKESESIQLFHAGTECSDDEESFVTSGGRVLAVVAQGETFDKAFETVYKGMDLIDFKGINFRKDIGNQVRKY